MPRRPVGSYVHRWHTRTRHFCFSSQVPGKFVRPAGRIAEEVVMRWAWTRGSRAHPSLLLPQDKYVERFNREADAATRLVSAYGQQVVEYIILRTGRGRWVNSLLPPKAEALVREERDRRVKAEEEAKARAAKFTPLLP